MDFFFSNGLDHKMQDEQCRAQELHCPLLVKETHALLLYVCISIDLFIYI